MKIVQIYDYVIINDSGRVVESNQYKAFGVKDYSYKEHPQATGYIGKEKDTESNLADHGVRKYDSDLGRFLCPDAMWEKYISYTPYQYCRNNPINAIDFNGMDDGAFGSWMQVGPTQELILGDNKVDTYQEVVENSEKPENKQLIKTLAEIGVMGMRGSAVKALLNAGIELLSGGDDGKREVQKIEFIQGTGNKARKVSAEIPEGFTLDRSLSKENKASVFKKDGSNQWISPDKDGHIGGIWKSWTSKKDVGKTSNRSTLNSNLEKIGD